MSFILDALKKSESDRQRQSGPALFEVKMPPPRRTLPAWAVAIGALLLVNLVIVAWMLLRHPAHGSEGGAADAVSPPPAARESPAPAAAAPAAPAPLSAATPAAAPSGAGPAAAAPPVTAAQPAPLTAAAPLTSPPLTSPALTAPSTPAGSSDNPDDYAPAAEPGAAPAFGSRVRRGTADGVPLYQEAAAIPGSKLPQLRLDLHVFAAHPQERFVMINMHKVHEGDTLPEGVHVDSITPEGAVLSYNGSRFLLPRD
jgi:general secretion pathway protein B